MMGQHVENRFECRTLASAIVAVVDRESLRAMQVATSSVEFRLRWPRVTSTVRCGFSTTLVIDLFQIPDQFAGPIITLWSLEKQLRSHLILAESD